MRAPAFILSCLAVSASGALAQPVMLDGPAGALGATLEIPEAPKAGIVFLPGSGPTDRDGNSPAGIAGQPYKLLADALAAHGIASLRGDKRGIGKSGGDGNDVSLAAYVDDAGILIDHLKAQAQISCVWLAGHSEGGLIALKAAPTRDDICGLILLATPGRPISVILLEQLRAVPALQPFLPDIEDAILALITGQALPPEKLRGPLQSIFAPQIQPFLMDLFAHAPSEMAAQAQMPVLVVQGDADLQIATEDAQLLVDALPQGTYHPVPDMTHMLKLTPGADRDANLQTYTDPDLPIAPGLVDRIVAFVTKGS